MSGPVSSTGAFFHIRDLRHGMKNLNVEFMILEPSGMNRTKDGDQVWVFKIADSTAAINFAVIGDAGGFLRPGDICKVLNGFCTMFKNALTFYVGKQGTFRRTGDFCFVISEEINMSDPTTKLPEVSTEASKQRVVPHQSSERRDSREKPSSSTSSSTSGQRPPAAAQPPPVPGRPTVSSSQVSQSSKAPTGPTHHVTKSSSDHSRGIQSR